MNQDKLNKRVYVTVLQQLPNSALVVFLLLFGLFIGCYGEIQEFDLIKINKVLEDGYRVVRNQKYDNCVILMGPTGAGKSTILNGIANN